MSDFLVDLWAGDRAAILTATAIYFVLTGAWSLAFCFRVRRWPSTMGRLTTASLRKFGHSMNASDQDYRANVLYEYDVDGQAFEGTRLSPTIIVASANARFLLRWQMKGIERVGEDGVRVFYKPGNPAKSYLIVPSNRTIGIVGIVMFGAAYLIYRAI